MIRLRRIIRDLFGFSRAQVNAFMVLLPLMFVVLFSNPLYRWIKPDPPVFSSRDRAMLDSLVDVLEYDTAVGAIKEQQARHFFRFDPNRVGVKELDSLGFSASLSVRIVNYRKKGGTFRVKNDLLKIYGVDTAFYRSLYSYIQLPEKIERKEIEYARSEIVHSKKAAPFDLNLADTSQLKKINGIGEKRALRIVRYREALGGFIEAGQLKEVYGLDSVVVDRLVKSSFIDVKFPLRRMNINKMSGKELSAHPYISESVAKAIVSYRFQHGDFRQVDDLRNIPMLDATTIRKITPYLEFD